MEEYLQRYVRNEVARGRRTAAEIVREAGWNGADPDAAWPLVAEAFAEYRADAATWPDVTDNDRLTAAFARLDAAGIVARESFTQTMTDGRSEIRGLMHDRPGARGFAFYHGQDEGSCVASGGLAIAYGTLSDDEDAAAAAGREVADALADEGLAVAWNGDPQVRIEVKMAWQVRRTGELAAAPPHPLPAGEACQVDRDGWEEWQSAPPVGRSRPAVFACAYLPLLPAGGSATIWGERTGIRFARDGDDLVAVVLGEDGEDEPPVRLAPQDAWPLVRDRLR